MQQGAQAAEVFHELRGSTAIEHRSQQLDIAPVHERFLVHGEFCAPTTYAYKQSIYWKLPISLLTR